MQTGTNASFLANLGPGFVPRHCDRFMVSGKLVTSKPQLKPQVGGRDNDAHVKLANVIYVSASEALAALVFHDELVLFQPVEVACYLA